MPTYEYECGACGARPEFFQPMGSKPKKTCPECGSRKLTRLIGAGAGIIFKGSGFYETDYRSDSYKQQAKEDTSKPASESKSSDTKPSESKSSSKKSDSKKSSTSK